MESTAGVKDYGIRKIEKLRKHEYFLRAGKKFTKIDDLSLWTATGWLLSKSWYEFLERRKTAYMDVLGSFPNVFQVYWTYLLYSGNNVVTLAPVGSGKTTFAIIESLLASGKVIFVVPTRVLMQQVYERLRRYAISLGIEKKILLYEADVKEQIMSGDFDIAVLSPQSFRIVFSGLRKRVSLAVVDDVDAFLKNPRNLDRLFDTLGKRGRVIFASATAKVSPEHAATLREKFGIAFVRSRFTGYRNVVDIAAGDVDLSTVIDVLMRKIGPGGLIFVRRGRDTSDVESILDNLGVKWHEADEDGLRKLESGEVDVLVGKASFYGKAVRGIDLPYRVKFALFVGVPSMEVVLDPGDDKIWEWLAKYGIKPEDGQPEELILRLASERGWYVEKMPDGRVRIAFPDFTTYIQASGRTSRLLGGDYTLGVSVVWEESSRSKFLEEFVRRSSWYGLNWVFWSEVEWDILRKLVEESRRLREGKPFEANLFLVESPHKVETILRLLGGGIFRYWQLNGWVIKTGEVVFGRTLYIIAPTIGHTNDIITKYDKTHSIYGVVKEGENFYPLMDTIKMTDIGSFVDVPQDYEGAIRDKLDLLVLYRRLSAVIGTALIATDPDSEGERIAYEVGAYLAPYARLIHRAEFHSITKNEVTKALKNPRLVNVNRFEAALTRRIEDRWVGFALSEVVQNRFAKKTLSAGRVQTPVLGWIIEAYQRYTTKVKKLKVHPQFLKDFWFLLPLGVTERDISVEEVMKNLSPLPPFTTDEMLREGISLLGLPASELMDLAQTLFEGGFITYHRTDSTRVSDDGLVVAKRYIEARYGKEEFVPRRWVPQESGREIQAAHEAIRPTRPLSASEIARLAGDRLSSKHIALYDLIFRRFMASQMSQAIVKGLRFLVEEKIVAEAITDILNPGFTAEYRYFKVYPLSGTIDLGFKFEKVLVPEGYPLTEADVVAMMKSRGIGRPSTYGKIIETIKMRRYVKVSPKRGWLIPTDLGKKVYAFLRENYPDFTAEQRTKILYERMDKVENGDEDYMEILWDIYRELMEAGLLADI